MVPRSQHNFENLRHEPQTSKNSASFTIFFSEKLFALRETTAGRSFHHFSRRDITPTNNIITAWTATTSKDQKSFDILRFVSRKQNSSATPTSSRNPTFPRVACPTQGRHICGDRPPRTLANFQGWHKCHKTSVSACHTARV